MDKIFLTLKNALLFRGIDADDMPKLISCLSGKMKSYKRGEMIFAVGERPKNIGIVCSGQVHVFTEDFTGNRTILTTLSNGELFGEAFACAGTEKLPVSAISVENSEILLMDYKKIISTCPNTCSFHNKLIENMLHILAEKNVALSQKVEIISKRTTREKLTAYLSAQSVKTGKRQFTIPFDRQELADFLCVERSAMSAEISKMQHEGLIKTNRSSFEILSLDDES